MWQISASQAHCLAAGPRGGVLVGLATGALELRDEDLSLRCAKGDEKTDRSAAPVASRDPNDPRSNRPWTVEGGHLQDSKGGHLDRLDLLAEVAAKRPEGGAQQPSPFNWLQTAITSMQL